MVTSLNSCSSCGEDSVLMLRLYSPCWSGVFTLILHLRQRTVELVDGVHHIQQHVVADHKFPLHVRRNRLKTKQTKKPTQREAPVERSWTYGLGNGVDDSGEAHSVVQLLLFTADMQSDRQLEAPRRKHLQILAPALFPASAVPVSSSPPHPLC